MKLFFFYEWLEDELEDELGHFKNKSLSEINIKVMFNTFHIDFYFTLWVKVYHDS